MKMVFKRRQTVFKVVILLLDSLEERKPNTETHSRPPLSSCGVEHKSEVDCDSKQ